MQREPPYVLLGDVADSREIPRRGAFRKRLEQSLETVNQTFEENLLTPCSIIRGIDEFGGVFDSLSTLYPLVKQVNLDLHPQTVRIVVVQDHIDINETSDDIAAMDGPAFHRGNELLEQVETAGLHFGMDTRLNRVADLLIANQVNLLSFLWQDWTERQVEAVQAYERFGTQTAAAKALNITQQTISERLMRTRWRELNQIEANLRESLRRLETK